MECHVFEANSTDDRDAVGSVVVWSARSHIEYQEVFPSFRRVSAGRLNVDNEPVVGVRSQLAAHPQDSRVGSVPLDLTVVSHEEVHGGQAI